MRFLTLYILDKAREIIGHYYDDPVLRAMVHRMTLTDDQRAGLDSRYFPSGEQLFAGNKEEKKHFWEELDAFFEKKYREGGNSPRFILPTKDPETDELSFNAAKLNRWREFARDTAKRIKGPASTELQTAAGETEVVSRQELSQLGTPSDFARQDTKAQQLKKEDGKLVKVDGTRLSVQEAIIEIDKEQEGKAFAVDGSVILAQDHRQSNAVPVAVNIENINSPTAVDNGMASLESEVTKHASLDVVAEAHLKENQLPSALPEFSASGSGSRISASGTHVRNAKEAVRNRRLRNDQAVMPSLSSSSLLQPTKKSEQEQEQAVGQQQGGMNPAPSDDKQKTTSTQPKNNSVLKRMGYAAVGSVGAAAAGGSGIAFFDILA